MANEKHEQSDQPLVKKSIDEIKAHVMKTLEASGIKRGTTKAALVEYSILNGIMFVQGRNAYLEICMLSGRSILDDGRSSNCKRILD